MGTFKFTWPHDAEDVFVTGTFDNWSKSEKLEKNGDVFEKTVSLSDASEKIYYKFVVDGTWTTNPDAPRETDHEGNENNVLKPEDIQKGDATTAIMNTVGPESTTAQLAGAVPLEKKSEVVVPGGFPQTPASELDKQIKVNPLPAADGAVNPIKLAPGEKVPEVSSEAVNSHVTLDKESYEKSDRIPGIDALPPVSANMIPESSLPIAAPGDVTINTVGANSTTAQLAGQVPLQPKVPEVVRESQAQAKADPEASGIAEEVKEKAQVEDELLKKVPEAPSTAEGTAGKGTEKAEGNKTLAETAAVAAAAAGAAAVETALVTNDSLVSAATSAAQKLPEPVKDALPVSVKEAAATEAKETKIETVSPEVPAEVRQSIAEAGKPAEAAANTTAVEEKKEVEAQLLKELKPTEAVGEASTPAKTNGAEPSAAPQTPSKAATPGPAESSTPSSSKPADSPAGTAGKKKNRLSSLFSKFKPGKKDKA